MKTLSKIFATFFGLGYFPIAPGTLTSFVIIVLYKYTLYKISWPYYLGLLFFIFIAGVLTSTLYAKNINKKDPRNIVIDEALGQFLALFALNRLSPSWFLLLVSFFLFRFFDIAKPPPIRRIETFPKGWGVMLDDVAAAIYTGICINLYLLIR